MKDKLTRLLRLHEGVRRFPYKCTAGKLTIGVGFNLDDVGLFPEEIDFILENRLGKLEAEVYARWPWVRSLDPVRRAVVLDMAFNLGTGRLAKFRMTLGHIHASQYKAAALEMLRSRWAEQVGPRATRLSKMMETGEWPDDLPE